MKKQETQRLISSIWQPDGHRGGQQEPRSLQGTGLTVDLSPPPADPSEVHTKSGLQLFHIHCWYCLCFLYFERLFALCAALAWSLLTQLLKPRRESREITGQAYRICVTSLHPSSLLINGVINLINVGNQHQPCVFYFGLKKILINNIIFYNKYLRWNILHLYQCTKMYLNIYFK